MAVINFKGVNRIFYGGLSIAKVCVGSETLWEKLSYIKNTLKYDVFGNHPDIYTNQSYIIPKNIKFIAVRFPDGKHVEFDVSENSRKKVYSTLLDSDVYPKGTAIEIYFIEDYRTFELPDLNSSKLLFKTSASRDIKLNDFYLYLKEPLLKTAKYNIDYITLGTVKINGEWITDSSISGNKIELDRILSNLGAWQDILSGTVIKFYKK